MLELKLLRLDRALPALVRANRVASSNICSVLLGRIVHFQLRWVLRIGPTILIILNIMLRLLRQVLELVSSIPNVQVVVSLMQLVLLIPNRNCYLRVPL